MILAGDIGGTNSRLAIFDRKLNKLEEKVTKNKGRGSLQEVVKEFLGELRQYPIDRATFGVAGPVNDGKVRLTNLHWELDEETLSGELGIRNVGLINDLVAHAEGVEVLSADKFITLNEGEAVHGGGRAVIAAGTGLGEAGLFWDRTIGHYRAFPSEGGHADFAPRDEVEDALLRFLRGRMRCVSYEAVLSGQGLKNIYEYLCSTGEFGKGERIGKEEVKPADITQAALAGTSAVAVRAMEMFVSIYGAEAGNLALKMLALGGVYLGGGIAPRIVEKLRGPGFMESFVHKGPAKLWPMMRKIPVRVINFELGGLWGAANYASRLGG